MIYPVVVYGHPVLRKIAREIPEDFSGIEEFVANMFETMYVSEGVGLAAPQVGQSVRFFVVDATPYAEDEPSLENFKKVFINPEITERFGDIVSFNEGCLSIPNIREDVNRKKAIKIRYQNLEGEWLEEEYDGIASRIIQHEFDHLNGVLFTDLVSPLRKKLLRGKLRAISKGKFKASYRTILPGQKVPEYI
ncbi:MAG TPA: peptide deformylase [Bacteroidetes bacterium]|nr:peptide deformylase [Bacteroidota bacterium]